MQTAKVKPAVNQVKMHVGMGTDPGGIRAHSAKLGAVVQAYSPLGAGTTGSPRTPELISGELVTSIGAKYGKTGPQVSLRWLVQNGVPVAQESTNAGHLAKNLDIFDWSLSDADMAALDAATQPAGVYSFVCSD